MRTSIASCPSARRLLVACLGLVACATPAAPSPVAVARPVVRVPEPSPTPPAPEPSPPPEPRIEGYEAVAEILAQRTVWWRRAEARMLVARRGPVRLRADGPDLGLADRAALPTPLGLWVLDETERPRVVTDQSGVRLLLHVDRTDAHPIVVARAPLRPQPSASLDDPPRGHVILEIGALVEVLDEADGTAQVRWQDGDRSYSGWVDASAIGTTARPVPPAREDGAEVYAARRSTPLRVRPGGKVLIAVEQDDPVVALTSKTTDGHRLVEYARPCQNDASYVGFVRAGDLRKPNYGGLHGCGYGGGENERPWGDAQAAPRVEVPAGRFLLDPERPVVIGCLLRPTELAELGDGTYAVATVWGPIPVRLAPEELEGRCGEGT